jgi:hypothetical protein
MKLVDIAPGTLCEERVDGGCCMKPAIFHDEDSAGWETPAFFCEEHKPTEDVPK